MWAATHGSGVLRNNHRTINIDEKQQKDDSEIKKAAKRRCDALASTANSERRGYRNKRIPTVHVDERANESSAKRHERQSSKTDASKEIRLSEKDPSER